MWDKRPRNAHGDEDDDSGGNSSYEIGHGSSDYKSYSIPSPAGSGLDSPGSEGLHHRKTYHAGHPIQQTAATRAGTNHSLDLQHPLAGVQRPLYRGSGHSNNTARVGRSHTNHLQHQQQQHQHHHHGLLRGNKYLLATSKWKKFAQCAFLTSLWGYGTFLYLAQNHYRKKGGQPQPQHREIHNPPLTGQYDNGDDAKIYATLPSIRNDKQAETDRFAQENRTSLDGQIAAPLGDMHDYIFKPVSVGHNLPQQPALERSALSLQHSIDWSTNYIKHTKTALVQRRKIRRQRTIPPYDTKRSDATGSVPYWYELHHSSEDTILSLHSRWKESDDEGVHSTATTTIATDPISLCGTHAQEAAKHHPKNYPPTIEKLGPHSRVLISGILSPLGLHLTIALHRQCGVVNFLGLDTMFPNDAFSRLEYQERLAVLMEELGETVELQVPFIGLEMKQTDKHARPDKQFWDDFIVRLRTENNETSSNSHSLLSTIPQYEVPCLKYGVHRTPGTARDGSGPLNAVLNYRPTHIVHLAGTQSDSLLNSIHLGNSVLQNKGDEEDDILHESISSRPHLYDLRMGAVGIEQLLSAAVVQMMLPSTVGPGMESKSIDLDKTTKPQIVYASTYDALIFRDTAARLRQEEKKKQFEHENLGSVYLPQPKRPARGLHGISRLIDELISSSYHALHNIPSIGLRFDAIYGSRGFGVSSASVPIYHIDSVNRLKRGVSADVDLAETAVRNMYRKWMDAVNKKAEQDEADEEDEPEERHDQGDTGRRLEETSYINLLEQTGWIRSAHDRRDFVFVEDAVGAIIAAMQYKSLKNTPITFNIGSGETSDLASLANEIQELAMLGGKNDKKMSTSKHVIDVEQSSAAHAASVTSNDYLRWVAKTSMKDGAAKLLAWHLDRAMPFFRSSSSDTDVDFSNSKPQEAAVDDLIPTPFDGETILSRRQLLPCSVNDPTCFRELHTSYPCSSECSTQSCVPSVFDGVMGITHEVTEDCDIVMYTISLGYDVVSLGLETEYSDGEDQMTWWETTVCTLAFVPSESTLVKKVIGQVPPEKLSDRGLSPDSSHVAKVEGLNGYLAHRGWVLILVDGTTKPMSAEDMFVPKLSPARLFHSSVRKAMFVDENFNHTPYPEDAQFLASETSRGILPKRTITGPDAKGHKTKYKLPEEPQRRAVLLVSPMRNIPNAESDRMPLKEIAISIMKDAGLNPDEIGESDKIRIQREYYERARSLINSMDLRSLDPVARNKIEIKDFIRSKWVVHHLKLEEGHQLRCEWYREHIRWGTPLDQLSFAYVMAKRELTRKLIMGLPYTVRKNEEDPILQEIIRMKSDAHEWHPIFSAEGAASALHHTEISPEAIPVNLQDLPDNEVSAVTPDLTYTDVGSTFYVRIMSDDQMLESRRRWTKARDAHRKYVTQMKEIERKKSKG